MKKESREPVVGRKVAGEVEGKKRRTSGSNLFFPRSGEKRFSRSIRPMNALDKV